MAFVHCHKCNWEQDDFYSPNGYNPAHYLASWDNVLFDPRIDQQFSHDAEMLRQEGPISKREVLAREYEKFAKRIRNMKWITWEQYKSDPDKKCPRCGNKDLCID